MRLRDPRTVGAPTLHGLPPIPTTSLPDRPVPILECGEELVAVESLLQSPAYRTPDWTEAQPQILVRLGVEIRLRRAETALPEGFRLIVLDGWRTEAFQQELHSFYSSRDSTLEGGYVSDPSNEVYVPPHMTGGAVDITLGWDGVPLSLGSDFDEFSPRSAARALEEGVPVEPDRSLRRLLSDRLTSVGFCPYPKEWWHYSYGDQVWAFNLDQSALYGKID